MKSASLALTLFLLAGLFAAHPTRSADEPAQPLVPYPEGYRAWTHVKSGLIGPAHASFAIQGGFQHVYANEQAMQGYRSGGSSAGAREFPEGSVIVFDWLEMTEKSGAFIEGPRRQVDVMRKDSKRYASSGGWGFQRFAKESKTELATAPTPQQCFACHEKLKKDGLVLGSYRP